jgi:hypothetical protein
MIREQEAVAYGFLNLKPWEFANLTPREFRMMVQGFSERQDWLMDALAWHAAVVISPWLKKAVQPYELRGKRKGKK